MHQYFFQYYPNFRGGGSKILHYIQFLTLYFKLCCVLLRRRRIFGKKRSNLSQHATCELLKSFPSTKVTLPNCSKFFMKTSWAYFKNCFLSFKYSDDVLIFCKFLCRRGHIYLYTKFKMYEYLKRKVTRSLSIINLLKTR